MREKWQIRMWGTFGEMLGGEDPAVAHEKRPVADGGARAEPPGGPHRRQAGRNRIPLHAASDR